MRDSSGCTERPQTSIRPATFPAASPGGPALRRNATILPLDQGAAAHRKAYLSGTHRARDPETTAALIRAHAFELGITRVANVTGLDYVGIPVTMAVRPASRNLSVLQGKGTRVSAALASGLMEALESFCSERIRELARTDSLRAVDGDGACLIPERLVRTAPDRDAKIPWTACDDLFGGAGRLAPSEIVFADFTSPAPAGQGYFVTTTNGLAAGNTLEEALIHALCELIERDATALWRIRARHGRAAPALALNSIAASEARGLLSLLDAAKMRVTIWDITSDLDVPSFWCGIDDVDSGRRPYLGRFFGTGAHPSADVALCRAIAEAAQSRLTLIAGARDDIDPDLYRWVSFDDTLPKFFAHPASAPTIAFEDRSFASESLARDLDAVLSRLERRGVGRVLFAPLPGPCEAVACVRAIVAELEGVAHRAWYRPGPRALALERALA